MKDMKEKGITLISLIITIIVLIILAVVTLNLTLGEKGIFSTAKQATQEYKKEVAREKVSLAVAEYEIKMKKETMYSILNKIQGLESIEPDDEQAGLPYKVVVDGYEFEITAELEIKYLGETKGEIPQIIRTNKQIENEEIKIEIQSKTGDKQGIEKIILIKDGIEIEEKQVQGKEITEKFEIKANGKYKIKVVGKNKKQAISEEIKVTEKAKISAQIQAGTVIDGGVLLTITGELKETEIEKIEIYEKTASTKIGEIKKENITIKENEQIEAEYKIEYIEFYEEKEYCAKIVTNTKTQETINTVKPKNVNTIKTEKDIKNLANVVNKGKENGGESFENKTIKQKENITLMSTHIAIGTENAPFKGTYDGGERTIQGLRINNNDNLQGMFGYIEKATIKNITLETGYITAGNKVGGIVGYAKESQIQNIKNKGTTVKSSTTFTEKVIYTYTFENTIMKESNHEACSVGGICGMIENTNVIGCTNNARVIGMKEGHSIGGIIGYAKNSENTNITNCINTGKIETGNYIGGIIGLSYGNVSIDNSQNNGIINSLGTNYSGNFSGGITGVLVGGAIKNSNNNNTITGGSYVGGITGGAFNTSTSTYVIIENCSNNQLGVITSTNANSDFSYYQQGTISTFKGAYAGGIVGIGMRSNISKCSNLGKIVPQNTSYDVIIAIGGINGEIRDSMLMKCYNKGEIQYNSKAHSVGGIVGVSYYNSYVNNCYNTGEVNGINNVAGIIGYSQATNIRYCYNNGVVKGNDRIGGIAGQILPHKDKTYTNNYLYYCYNIGNVTGNVATTGNINGYIDYCDVEYVYSIGTTIDDQWGKVGTYKNATYQDIYSNKTAIINAMLNHFSENFTSDYTGTQSINNGNPILKWEKE